MTKARSVSFLNAFKTMAEAEDWLTKIKDPGVVVHLWTPIQSLFAICTQSALDGLQKELDQAKKDKP
jgi:hypothetical protein